jgi:hypothetical protein
MESKTTDCVMCHRKIDPECLSFEQRLIDDRDFCRECWDDIMFGEHAEEVPLPVLVVEGR